MDQYTVIRGVDCERCSSTPVVGLRAPNGEDIICTNLCGPHFFADRAMVDPERWNDQQEATE